MRSTGSRSSPFVMAGLPGGAPGLAQAERLHFLAGGEKNSRMLGEEPLQSCGAAFLSPRQRKFGSLNGLGPSVMRSMESGRMELCDHHIHDHRRFVPVTSSAQNGRNHDESIVPRPGAIPGTLVDSDDTPRKHDCVALREPRGLAAGIQGAFQQCPPA